MQKRAIPILVLLILVPVQACFNRVGDQPRIDNSKAVEDKAGEAKVLSDDVVPKTLAFPFLIPDPGTLYYGWYNHRNLEDMSREVQKHLREIRINKTEALKRLQKIDETHFPHYENGEIHPPKKYDVEKKYSKKDRKKLKVALKVAYRYADINEAFEDGYRLMPRFIGGMGIHMINIDYLMSNQMNVEEPEMLTYVKSRKNERFMLVSLGYIYVIDAGGQYRLFDSHEAQGHFRLVRRCIRIEKNIYAPVKFFEGNCDEKRGDYIVGNKWMMHVAVNLYNEEGIFAGYSSVVNDLSLTDINYSFYGKNMEE